MVCDTSPSQDVTTHQIWNSYLKEYRRYAPDTKRDGRTDWQCDFYIYASLSSFGGIKKLQSLKLWTFRSSGLGKQTVCQCRQTSPANSADQIRLIRAFTVCHCVCMFWAIFAVHDKSTLFDYSNFSLGKASDCWSQGLGFDSYLWHDVVSLSKALIPVA